MVYHASSLGGCLRSLVASRLGITPKQDPKTIQRLALAAREGKRHEVWIALDVADELRNQGFVVDIADAVYCNPCKRDGRHIELDLGVAVVTGHIDRDLTLNGKPYIAEWKTKGRFEYERWLKQGFTGFRKHAYQVSLYMHQTGLPAVYGVKCRDTGRLDVRILSTPPISQQELRNHVADAERGLRNEVLPDCRENEFSCEYCYLPKVTETPSDPALEKAAADWRRAKVLLAEAEDLETKARQALENTVAKSSTNNKSYIDGLVITYIPPTQYQKVNQKKLQSTVDEAVLQEVLETVERKGYITIKDTRES